MGRIEAKLAELGLALPRPMPPVATYVPFVTTGNLVVVSGQLPATDGQVAVTGKLGRWLPVRRHHAIASVTSASVRPSK